MVEANPDNTFAKVGLLPDESVVWLTARRVASAVCDFRRLPLLGSALLAVATLRRKLSR